MGLVGYDLNQYPLEQHYRNCRKYINDMDWDEIVNATREKGTIGVDVSNAIILFPHLELDSEYRLICYTESDITVFLEVWKQSIRMMIGHRGVRLTMNLIQVHH
jgi:hypothetical protein